MKTNKLLLSYLSLSEKYNLVGSFVIENFWEYFIKENKKSIDTFRSIAKNSIEHFIEVYQDVWDYVIEINRIDDLFLINYKSEKDKLENMSLREVEITSKLLALSLYSELEKDCLMALNKSILTELSELLKERRQLTNEDYQLLMTPSFQTFFTKYHFDHFEYSISKDKAHKKKLGDILIKTYHAGDPKLFRLRFRNMHFPKDGDLESVILAQKERILQQSKRKKKFIGKDTELVAFEKLLEYDNFLDFKYRYNLEACPEYYIREILLEECKKNGIFQDIEKPLKVDDISFIQGVNTLLNIKNKSYRATTRKNIEINNYKNIKNINEKISSKLMLNNLYKGNIFLISISKKEHILVIGYKQNKLITLDNDGREDLIEFDDLKEISNIQLIEKYDIDFYRTINKMLSPLIARTPYLERGPYEAGINV